MKVALLQCSSGDELEANIRWLEETLPKVAGADLIVLPEMWPFLVPDTRGDERLAFAEKYGQSLMDLMAKVSLNSNSCIVSGSFFLPSQEKAKVTNSSLVYKEGRELGRYHKRHLFDNRLGGYQESKSVSAGKELVTFPLSDWTVGQSICYDLRFSYHFSSLRAQGADLVVCPSAFTWKTGQAHWEVLVRTRAIENQLFMVAVNQCGLSPAGVHCWGHSLVVDPWGEILLDLGEEPGFGMVDISLEKVQSCRKKMPVWEHRLEEQELE